MSEPTGGVWAGLLSSLRGGNRQDRGEVWLEGTVSLMPFPRGLQGDM